ncbi:VOC family protein [Paenibacillus sambharensis]|uniref:VOC family protein n=1 Tax=Paenibacillus sambharensis TaxID=1803190 RepID=A0A2W1LSC9_9BACL|nr:VOC family protein [Paenibacillus sambharensis]PZD97394.1 VOC family protein [Paenibacillus sambharensis]
MNKPYFKFDGGFIMVPWDQFDEAVEWYGEKMGWQLKGTADTPVGRKAFFGLPGMGQANLKAFESGIDHFTRDGYEEGHCRFCFQTGNLDNALVYFKEQGVTCSDPVVMPDGSRSADITAFGGIRLSLNEDRSLDGQFPDSRVIQFASKPLWLGVSRLNNAIEWYGRYLGLALSDTDYSDKGFALMQDDREGWDVAWLQQVDMTPGQPKANPGARLYFHIESQEDFNQANTWLKNEGIEVSDSVGERWQGFHFYDPDGNRLNVWTYY